MRAHDQSTATAPIATPTTPIAKPNTPLTSTLAPGIAAPDLLALALALAADDLDALALALWLADAEADLAAEVSEATTELAAEVMAAAPDEPADEADTSTLEASEAREEASIEVVPVAEARVAVTLPEVTDTAPQRACWSWTAACWSDEEQFLSVSERSEPPSLVTRREAGWLRLLKRRKSSVGRCKRVERTHADRHSPASFWNVADEQTHVISVLAINTRLSTTTSEG